MKHATNRKPITIVAIVLAVLLVLFGGGIYGYNAYKKSKAQGEIDSLLIRDHSYIYGNKDAKVTVVEFFDPACPTCVYFSETISKLPKLYENKVRVVYRPLPLHSGSDLVLSLVEAARDQGRYEEALSLFNSRFRGWFINNQANMFIAWGIVEQAGVDTEKAKEYLSANQEKINGWFQQNFADASALGVTGTPTFFINSKRLEKLDPKELINAVEAEIERVY